MAERASAPSFVGIDALPFEALVVEVHGLRVVAANGAARRLLGPAVNVATALPHFFPELDRGDVLALAAGGRREVELTDARGRHRTADLRVSPIDGAEHVLVVLAETTQHRRTEASLRKAFLTQKTLSDLLRSTLDDRPLETQLRDALALVVGLPWAPFGPRAGVLLSADAGLVPAAVLHGALPLADRREEPFVPCACGAEILDAEGACAAWRLFPLDPSDPVPMVLTPLDADGHVVGQLIVQCASAEDIDPFEMDLLRVVARHLAHVVVHVRARESAREQAMSLRVIFDRAVNAIVCWDAQGRITNLNPAAEEMFGWSRDEVLGALVERIIPPDPTWAGQSCRDLIGVPRELEARRRDGQRFPILLEVSETPRGGEMAFTAFIRDETERHRVRSELIAAREAALEASETKSRFLANMSHEIRTPMNGVIGMTDLLLATPLDPKQRDAVETIRGSGEALLSVINDVLDFSRIEAGRLEIHPEPFPLARVVDEVVRLLGPKADEKAIGLHAHVDPELPPWVLGDAGRIRQILINLLGNALKFTERGQVSIQVARAGVDEVRFSVEDTGIGMTADVLGRLFRPFVQADGSITRRFGGTGLGLTISRQLAELMRGRLLAESAPGRGSTFTLELALPRAQPVEEMTTEDLQQVDVGALHVLLVEDNLVNQKVAARMLERLGYTVDLAVDGREGVTKALAGRYDLVLMDCQMPVLDGFEATRELRRAGCEVPIIALTANAMKGDEERCRAAGMNAFLSKPVRQKDVERAIARLVSQQRRAELEA